MMIIALTGGIGAGKTTVANCFKDLGIDVYDTDVFARQVVEPNTKAFKAIVARFGAEILNNQQQLDRHKLRDIVFQSDEQRQWLETLLHPLIRDEMFSAAKSSTSAYCLFVIPLLFETKFSYPVNRILVVDADESLQQIRTQKRDGLRAEQIERIMAQQVSRQFRKQQADDVIENNDDANALKQQVLALHQQYLTLASQRK